MTKELPKIDPSKYTVTEKGNVIVPEKEYPPLNNLPYEERKRISYYKEQAVIEAIDHILLCYKNDITQNLKSKMTRWRNAIKEDLKREYGE